MDTPKKILLVDDDKQLRDMLGESLRNAGFEVDSSGDGDVALDMFSHNEYGLILLDIEMPNITGISVLSRIREKDREVMVVMLTNSDKTEDLDAARTLGVTDYWIKANSDLQALVERVRLLL